VRASRFGVREVGVALRAIREALGDLGARFRIGNRRRRLGTRRPAISRTLSIGADVTLTGRTSGGDRFATFGACSCAPIEAASILSATLALALRQYKNPVAVTGRGSQRITVFELMAIPPTMKGLASALFFAASPTHTTLHAERSPYERSSLARSLATPRETRCRAASCEIPKWQAISFGESSSK